MKPPINAEGNETSAKILPRQFAKTSKGKGHVDRWAKAVYRPKSGKGTVSADFCVRIMFAGRRVNFPLHTSNNASAARKAADIYAHLTVNGWEETLRKFKPQTEKPDRVATVGELIEAAKMYSSSSAATFGCYERALRTIASEIAEIEASADRYNHRSGGSRKWREKVDAISLEKLNAATITAWRKGRLNKAEGNPLKERKAAATADSLIRSAKSLFGKKILPHLHSRITLPEEIPFSSTKWKLTIRRFRPTVTAEKLTMLARKQLLEPDDRKKAQPEVYKAFVLCLYLGLRRAEADRLTWSQIDFAEGVVSIRPTQYFRPKTEEAIRDIHLQKPVLETVSKMRAGANPVFVLHGGKARSTQRYAYYRADAHPWRTWEKLADWLRKVGFDSPKPIHDLRKMAGSLIYTTHGLEVARDFLGHNSIATTANSYVANKAKIMVEIEESGSGKKDNKKETRIEENTAS